MRIGLVLIVLGVLLGPVPAVTLAVQGKVMATMLVVSILGLLSAALIMMGMLMLRRPRANP